MSGGNKALSREQRDPLLFYNESIVEQLLSEDSAVVAEGLRNLHNCMSEHLVRWFWPRVDNNYHDALDLAADTILDVLDHIHTFDPNKGSFKSWIFWNRARGILRDWKRDQVVQLDITEVEFLLPQPTVSAENEYIVGLRRQKLDHVFLQLSSAKQRLYTLCFEERKTYREIALDLDIPVGTVRSKVSRLRQDIKNLLHE